MDKASSRSISMSNDTGAMSLHKTSIGMVLLSRSRDSRGFSTQIWLILFALIILRRKQRHRFSLLPPPCISPSIYLQVLWRTERASGKRMQLACSGYYQKQLIGSVGRVPRFSDNIEDRGSELKLRSSCFRGALKLVGCNASRRRNKARSDVLPGRFNYSKKWVRDVTRRVRLACDV